MDNFTLTTLQEDPSHERAVKELIETSFGYNPNEDLFVDFAPLFQREAAGVQNYLLKDERTSQIAGHIGIWKRELIIGECSFPIILIGGVAMDEQYRGQGYFREFMKDILERHHNECAFYLLWSDLSDMYAKMDFYEVGLQIHRNPQKVESSIPGPFQKTPWKELTESDLKTLNSLHHSFFNSHPECIYLKRDLSTWKGFQNISSSELYLYKKNQEILGYAVRNKGMDLAGIIHDYACDPQIEAQFFEKLKSENLWSPHQLLSMEPAKEEHSLYLGLIKVANNQIFQNLCSVWTEGELEIPETFNKASLRQLFGPTWSNTLSWYRPFYVGGLESI